MNQHIRKTPGMIREVCAVAIAIVLFAPAAQADGLGRLFFTPEQRAQLDHGRMRAAAEKTDSVAPGKTEAPEIVEEESDSTSVLTVNGIVQKRGGARTVWINGVAQNADSGGERAPESLTVTVQGKVQPVKIKVGQKLLLESPPQPKPATRKPAGQEPQASGNEED